jgi:hypothetical protein
MVELLARGEVRVGGQPLLQPNLNSFIVYPAIALMGEF